MAVDVGGDVAVDVDVLGDGDVLGELLLGCCADGRLRSAQLSELDVCRCAADFLTLAFDLSSQVRRGNAPMLDHLHPAQHRGSSSGGRAAPMRRGTYAIARGSAMECAAIRDALEVLHLIEAQPRRRGIERR